ncbi:amino acid ABC transporter permease [Aquamicrobium zhengzhouense]|uniref:Amino acid ABC transporter permease n=1 Tax=Aquamicrobium zhengzhouense TaxID=2781738 RepID=A0ABS0SD88_9HYPH|nr:amino acid ABC transporter permease [Aquamicrobium zhengzhouense]MBI1620393.1 amino acid ABC transporter permease [Aquamicrobium zhengzhouense]
MASNEVLRADTSARVSWMNDPKIRGIVFQIIVVAILAAAVYWIWGNTVDNLRRANISSGFGFLNRRSGFDVSQSLIDYTSDSSFRQALIVGLLNTVLVAVCGIITATIIGFLVGIGRLSGNWLIAKICMVYVELFRNIPPLLVIFFWYLGVLSVLPGPRDSISLPFSSYLNNRGFFLPKAIWGDGAWLITAALLIGIVAAFLVGRWAYRRRMQTGQPFPTLGVSLGCIIGLPLLVSLALGVPLTFEFPQKGTFNLSGGFQVKPEFLSLYLALSFYTASFIAEIVRAGILGVSRGQSEAAHALGLRARPTLRLVIVPQAMRIIIPPLTSQYLNLTKNSSLAVFVGYPDLVQIGQTTMNQTGQAIEVVAIWMVIYLGLSISTSAFMNWFNAKMALVER